MTLVWRHRSKTFRPIMGVLTLSFFLNVGAFALLAGDALAGVVSLGALATLVQALFGLEAFGPLGDPQSELARNTAAVAELVALRRTIGLGTRPTHALRVGAPDPSDLAASRALTP